jgi:hypothetical protein
VGADCIRRLPPDLEFWFLSVVQKEQLVTIYRNCGTAKKFIRLSEFKARGTFLEVSALASAKKLALMSLCRGLGLSTSSRNKKEEGMVIYQRTREHALQLVETEIQCVLCAKRKLRSGTVAAQNFSCMRTITSFLFTPAEQSLRIQHALDETSDQPNYFDSEIKSSMLATAAVNVHLARATRAARVDGNYLAVGENKDATLFYDYAHLTHNIGKALIKQPLSPEGEGFTSKECVLPRLRLVEAARAT